MLSPQVPSAGALLKASLQATLLAVRVATQPRDPGCLTPGSKGLLLPGLPGAGVCGDLAVTASYRTSGPSFFFPFLLGHVLLGGCLHMSVSGLSGEGTFQPEAEVICGP